MRFLYIYKSYKNINRKDLKITEKISKNILSLPFYPGIKKQQIQYIFKIISKNKALI